MSLARAQEFEVETLKFSGDKDTHLNLLILGDGYTAEEQTKFIADSKKVIDYLFSIDPWKNYTNFFNAYAIKVISLQSGVNHPKTANDCGSELEYKNKPFFGSTFDGYGIHRALMPMNLILVERVISNNFSSKYAQAIILANSNDHGGTGGQFATLTNNVNSRDVLAHELGHSFARLADEYEVGNGNYYEAVNMTKTSNSELVKWKNWIGFRGVAVFKHGTSGDAASWYRPHNNCRMRTFSGYYCPVCMQGIVEAIHKKANIIASYTPSNAATISAEEQYLDFNLTELLTPIPNTLKIQWKLDNVIVGENVNSVKIDQNELSKGMHNLAVTVTDESEFLKVDNHETVHLNTVNWKIDKSTLGVDLNSIENKISYSMYPNPANNLFKIEFDLDQQSEISIALYTIDGKKIQQIESKTITSGKYSKIVDVQNLATGSYLATFKIDDVSFSKIILKQ